MKLPASVWGLVAALSIVCMAVGQDTEGGGGPSGADLQETIDVYVRRLREKIEKDPEEPVYLKTVRGTGYKYEAPK